MNKKYYYTTLVAGIASICTAVFQLGLICVGFLAVVADERLMDGGVDLLSGSFRANAIEITIALGLAGFIMLAGFASLAYKQGQKFLEIATYISMMGLLVDAAREITYWVYYNPDTIIQAHENGAIAIPAILALAGIVFGAAQISYNGPGKKLMLATGVLNVVASSLMVTVYLGFLGILALFAAQILSAIIFFKIAAGSARREEHVHAGSHLHQN